MNTRHDHSLERWETEVHQSAQKKALNKTQRIINSLQRRRVQAVWHSWFSKVEAKRYATARLLELLAKLLAKLEFSCLSLAWRTWRLFATHVKSEQALARQKQKIRKIAQQKAVGRVERIFEMLERRELAAVRASTSQS